MQPSVSRNIASVSRHLASVSRSIASPYLHLASAYPHLASVSRHLASPKPNLASPKRNIATAKHYPHLAYFHAPFPSPCTPKINPFPSPKTPSTKFQKTSISMRFFTPPPANLPPCSFQPFPSTIKSSSPFSKSFNSTNLPSPKF